MEKTTKMGPGNKVTAKAMATLVWCGTCVIVITIRRRLHFCFYLELFTSHLECKVIYIIQYTGGETLHFSLYSQEINKEYRHKHCILAKKWRIVPMQYNVLQYS